MNVINSIALGINRHSRLSEQPSFIPLKLRVKRGLLKNSGSIPPQSGYNSRMTGKSYRIRHIKK